MSIKRSAAWMAAAAVAFAVAACGDSKQEQERLNQLAIQRLNEQKTPEQKAADAKRAAEMAEARAREEKVQLRLLAQTKAVRAGLKNPRSFELVDLVYLSQTDTACIVYRGTNSFNAIVTENKALSADGRLLDWNGYCAGKSGSDWSRRIGQLL